MQRFDRIRNSKGGNKPGEVRPRMQEAMQSGFGVFRRGDILKEGLDKLERCAIRSRALPSMTIRCCGMSGWSRRLSSPISPTSGGDRAFRRAPVPNRAALMHVRTYHQRDDKNWLKHTVAWKDEDWNVTFAYRPVRLDTLSNEVQSFPPAERTH